MKSINRPTSYREFWLYKDPITGKAVIDRYSVLIDKVVANIEAGIPVDSIEFRKATKEEKTIYDKCR